MSEVPSSIRGGCDPERFRVDDRMRIARGSTAPVHPHCMAHRAPPPLPGAALAKLVSARLDAVPIEVAAIEVRDLYALLGHLRSLCTG